MVESLQLLADKALAVISDKVDTGGLDVRCSLFRQAERDSHHGTSGTDDDWKGA